jgi:hypothetical protein
VYRLVFEQAKVHFEDVLCKLQRARPAMEAVIRTDMDQIITSKEHLASKIRGRRVRSHWQMLAHSQPSGARPASSECNPSLACLLFC